GNGDGTFATPTPITVPGPVARLRGLGDVNGDGRPDLGLTTNATGSTPNLLLLRNTGTPGNFTFAAPVELLQFFYQVGYASAADLNGDGKRDVVAISFAASSVIAMFGDGAGGFAGGVNFVIGSENYFEIADVNGDGRPDLIGTRPNANDIYVLLN